MAAQEKIVSAKLEESSSRAAQLIAENRGLLDALAAELLKKGVLMADDVREIMQPAAANETIISHTIL